MAAKDTNEDAKSDDQDAGHSLDMSQAAVKKMIGEAREKGYITYDQLNTVLPPDQVSSEQIEDVMSMLSEMGINVIEDEEVEEEDAKGGTEVATTKSWTARTTPYACTCGRWGPSNCSAVRARSPSPSGSRQAAIQ